MQTLTLRELNRALLARQLLLGRELLPVVRAVERVAGLQAQWEPSLPLGLHARLDGFDPARLQRALVRRSLVRATLMRATIHLVSTRDYLHFHPALLAMIRRKWIQYRGRDAEEIPELCELAARVLAAAREPRPAVELQALLGPDDERATRWFRVRHHVPFLRVGGDYVAAEAWLGKPYEPAEKGLRLLLRRYLAAWGPATAADAAAWTGLQVAELREALERVGTRRFGDEQGRTLYDLPDAPLPPADTAAPPRLLPRFDNFTLSHADRRRAIADEHRKVTIRAGEVDAVFLVDGFVAGRWRRRGKRVELEPFVRLTRTQRAALDDEAAAVLALAGG